MTSSAWPWRARVSASALSAASGSRWRNGTRRAPDSIAPCDDAVVDQRIVHDHVVAAEQMADDRDIGRMAADQRDGVLGAVNARQRPFQLAVDRPLAGHRAARRHRGAVAVDRRLRRRGDSRVAVEPEIIVRGEIDVGAVADQRLGAGDPLMHAKERIADAEIIRRLLDHADFAVAPRAATRRAGRRSASGDRSRLGAAAAGTPERPASPPRKAFRPAAPWPAPTIRTDRGPPPSGYSAAADFDSTGSIGSAASATAASRSSSAAS